MLKAKDLFVSDIDIVFLHIFILKKQVFFKFGKLLGKTPTIIKHITGLIVIQAIVFTFCKGMT